MHVGLPGLALAFWKELLAFMAVTAGHEEPRIKKLSLAGCWLLSLRGACSPQYG